MLVLVFLARAGGSLAGLLGGLSTLAGLALFAWLWALSCWGARQALRSVPLERPPGPLAQDAVAYGLLWGGVVGMAFLGGLLLAGAAFAVAREGVGILVAGAAFTLLAVPFAGMAGLVVGGVFAALDVGLLLAARRLARA